MVHRYYVTTSRGLVPLLAAELRSLGAGSVREDASGCRVRGPLEFAYRICLWSRIANRVLLPLTELVAESADDLHAGVREIPWEDHVRPTGSIAVDFSGTGAGVTNTQFGAQKVKDAIVDRLRDKYGARPSVDKSSPDLRVNVHVRGKGVVVSIDLSGGSLHRRGYRLASGGAPIKETLAAAMLRFSGWVYEAPLLDPMCGAGTIAIEAAMMAAGIAPGMLGRVHGFERWLGHDGDAWKQLETEAKQGVESPPNEPSIFGCDRDPNVLEAARDNATRAGVQAWLRFDVGQLGAIAPPSTQSGWIVSNPPYGERMGDKAEAAELLGRLGVALHGAFGTWRACVITPDEPASVAMLGLPAQATLAVDNGPIAARISTFFPVRHEPSAAEASTVAPPDIVNRLRKNHKRLGGWAQRHDVHCYRLYDADIPEYNAAIDIYEDHVHVQEYEAPKTIDPDVAATRFTAVTAAASHVLDVPMSNVHVKVRRPQRGKSQYERQSEKGDRLIVGEGGHRFVVNLTDYLDTGLFLDHRSTRALVQRLAKGKRFLNLFCYTASFTVYAAKGGATSSVSVDMSNTYLEWARKNFDINGLPAEHHRLVRADCLEWLESDTERFDLAVLDPPTFSNSKGMEGTLDIQRDHAALIGATMRRLEPDGVLLFSTNARRFRITPTLEEEFDVDDITPQTVPEDFRRGAPPHRCWFIRRKSNG